MLIKPLHQEAFFVFLGQVISAIGTLVGVKVLTSYLQPESYGFIALGMSVVNLSIYLVGTPVGSSATRFYKVAMEGGHVQEYENALRRVGGGVGVCLLLAALVLLLAGNYFYCLIAVLSVLLCVDGVFNGIQTGARNRRIVALMQSLLNWSRFIFAVGLIVLTGCEYTELVFLGFCLSAMGNVGLQIYFYRRKIRIDSPIAVLSDEPFDRGQFYSYLWPLVITGMISWGQLFLDRWGLGAFATLEEVGIYFALYQISYAPVLLFNSCVYYFVSPILFEKAGNARDATRMRKVYAYNGAFSALTLLLSFALAGGMWLLQDWIGQLLLGSRFLGYSNLLPWLVLSGGIFATGTQLLLSIQSGLYLKPLLVQKMMSAIVAALCYLLGTYWYGLPGVVFGGLIFAVFYATTAFIFHVRLIRNGKI